tara:strand:+ start:1532 stop:1756 length:225 start_codon:yes stop_codon:yes gene_type:complete
MIKSKLEEFKRREELEKRALEEYSRKAKEAEQAEQIDKDNEDIMKRMHPAVLIPGVLVGLIVIAGCIYKGYMGW